MSLDQKTVAKVAKLARIRMTDEEIQDYVPKINGILKWIEQLAEVDTDNVEPLPSPVDIALRLRDDALTDGAMQQDVLKNAPEAVEGFYVVPKVVE
jgi:aspartyl-tRNA(Asn)/glutamyl-tRNA(Gln) amidotransferase subunit C